MESHNADLPLSADTAALTPLARAARLSHYVRRLLDAEPELHLDGGSDRAFSA